MLFHTFTFTFGKVSNHANVEYNTKTLEKVLKNVLRSIYTCGKASATA